MRAPQSFVYKSKYLVIAAVERPAAWQHPQALPTFWSSQCYLGVSALEPLCQCLATTKH